MNSTMFLARYVDLFEGQHSLIRCVDYDKRQLRNKATHHERRVGLPERS
jgi:hypothetical protein